jgi:adenylosuccinate synthase
MDNSSEAMRAVDYLFKDAGATVLVDGQYGSTGKGVIAAALAEWFSDRVDHVISNAGPNSGHTSYYRNRRIVLKQLPTFGVTSHLLAHDVRMNAPGTKTKVPDIHLSAGAIINREILREEMDEYDINTVFVHPYAAAIDQDARDEDRRNVRQIASTGQGVGPAMQRKMSRVPEAVVGPLRDNPIARGYPPSYRGIRDQTIFMEVSQGFSLGINSGFYPHVTTRECTVSQALSDAGLPPTLFRDSVLAVRTYPIRVGSTENSSGPCYVDQRELSWEELGVEPEMTTVTKRVRRVFTWSNVQFMDAVFANSPSVIFCNFLNYLKPEDVHDFIVDHILLPYNRVMGKNPGAILLGYGPKTSNIRAWSAPQPVTVETGAA